MTHEELKVLAQAFIDQGVPSALMTTQGAAGYQLAEAYLALVKELEEAKAEIDRQSECERAMIGAVRSWARRAEAAEFKLVNLESWRKWARFVFGGAGEKLATATDDELREMVCARYDEDVAAAREAAK